MATVTATKTGNWSDPTVWSTGALPQSGDTVRPATYVVTIDQSIDIGVGVLEATTTGYFKVAVGGLSITCATILATYGKTLSDEHTSGTVTITGNVTHANTTSGRECINKTAGGNLIINGVVTGPNGGSQNMAIRCDYSCGGTITINGNCLYESVQTVWGSPTHNLIVNGNVIPYSVYGIQVPASGTATITGQLTGSLAYSGYAVIVYGVCVINANLVPTTSSNNESTVVTVAGGGRLTVNGNLGSLASAVSAAFCVKFSGNGGQATINGNVYGGSGTWYSASAIYCISGTGLLLTVNGDVYAGTNAYGIVASNMTATINGTVYALDGSTFSGVFANTGSTVHVRKAVGNNYGPGGGSAIGYAILGDRAASLVTVKQVQCGTYGAWPINGFAKLLDDVDLNQVIVPKSTSGTKTLVDPASTGYYPTAANVRSGVSYAAGNLTGTCAVPAAGSVALGVPVDNTTGTAVLTRSNVESAVGDLISQAIASQTGTGARIVAVTVTDGTDPIEGALIRFTKGGETFVQSTNVDGEKSFSLNDGTWTVSITANGFSFTPTTLVVDGNEIVTYVMTPVATPTPSPGEGQVTGVGNVYDEYGELDSSKTVYAQMILAARATGFFDGKVAEYTPIAGIVTIPKLFKTATYQFWIGNSSKRLKFYVPETDEDSIDLPPILGDECDDCTA